MDEARATSTAAPERIDGGFLAGGGEMGARIRAHDWAATPLGPIAAWPQSLRTATAILLRSPVPIVMLWSEEGIMIYNDAYSVFAGGRHPRLLGSKVREGWPEVAAFNDNVMKVGLAGGTLAYRDQELTLYRNGVAEQVWMNLDYSPVLDETGEPAGVIAIVVETTKRVLAERRIAAEREQLARMFEQAPSLMALLRGPDHVFELANPSYLRLIGGRQVIGRSVREALPELAGQGFFELLDDAYRTGTAFVGTGMRVALQPVPDRPPEEHFIDFVYQPISDAAGRVSGIFVEGTDVTERRRGEEALEAMVAQQVAARQAIAESEERFRLIVESAADFAIFTADFAGNVTSWNSGAQRILGYEAEEIIGKPASIVFTPEDRANGRPEAEMRGALAGENVDDERWHLRKDGSRFWASGLMMPLKGEAGEVRGFLKVLRDRTGKRREDERRKLLLDELNHRVKNTLATVQSIAAQSFRGDAPAAEARAAFESRLLALSRAHSLLTRESWSGIGLRDLATESLEPFKGAGDAPERIAIAGDNIRLRPRIALALGMALHELATNAAKYGALSNAGGRVALRWERRGEGRGLRLRWSESGGPPVAVPLRKGFGSRLIERGLARELGGTVRLDYAPDGVVCEIEMPADASA